MEIHQFWVFLADELGFDATIEAIKAAQRDAQEHQECEQDDAVDVSAEGSQGGVQGAEARVWETRVGSCGTIGVLL